MLHSKLARALQEFATDKGKKWTKLTTNQTQVWEGSTWEEAPEVSMPEMQGRELVPQKFFQDTFFFF